MTPYKPTKRASKLRKLEVLMDIYTPGWRCHLGYDSRYLCYSIKEAREMAKCGTDNLVSTVERAYDTLRSRGGYISWRTMSYVDSKCASLKD